MAKLKKGSFPGIARQGKQNQSESAITENIEILTGQRGNGENRALLVKDLVNLDDMKRRALINSASGGNQTGGLPITTGGIERPHKPINLVGTGGFTFIALTWDRPTYRGHAYAEIWRSESDVFSTAIKIATEVTDIFSDSVNMGAEFYYWVRFVNVADMVGPTQGANGLYVKTQKSAELILDEIGGLIEQSHLGDFLSSTIDAIPDLELAIDEVVLETIPALQVNIDDFSIDIAELRTEVDQFLIDIPDIHQEVENIKVEIPSIYNSIENVNTEIEAAKQSAQTAKDRVESIEISSDDLARQLIDAALINDENWQNNSIKLIEFESKLDGVNARITSEFLTKTEANEAIAAAADTIQVMIEENGLALSGDIQNTYYTKATTDQAIALATSQIKAEIEDPNGDSLGALINSDYYTSAESDNVIAAYGLQLKTEIEDPNGDSIGATLQENYYTKTATDSALSQLTTNIESIIEAEGQDTEGRVQATLDTQYYTSVQADNAISQATTQLQAQLNDDITATLTADYFTSAETDQAVSIASQLLKSEIEDPEGGSIGATLFNDYSTKVDTEQAVARAIFELNSQFDPLAQAVIENALANDEAIERQQVITANILRTQEVITNESQALAQSLSVIETQFNDSSARITALDKAISTSLTSSAEKIFQLDSKVDNNRAYLEVNYLTKVDTNEAISQATTQLQSNIDDATADVYQNFFTKTQASTAISQAVTALRSDVETDIGNVVADLQSNYYTSTDTDSAISQATQLLQATIEDPNGDSIGATLVANYSTTIDINQAISEAKTLLNSNIDDLSSDIYQNFSTKTDTESAISTATTALKSTIDSDIADGDQGVKDDINADLQVNYSTKAQTGEAISQATTALKSEIEDPQGNSIGATLFNDFQTKADAEEASASTSQQLRAEFEPSAQAIIENALANDLEGERRVFAEADLILNQRVLANEQSALSESIFVLNASIDESKAGLYQLQTTFATKAQATAQDLLKLDSDVGDVKADLVNNYFTSADVNEAIASADTALRAAIEDPAGDSIGADLQTNYYTKAAADSVISSATTQLKSAIEDPDGDSLGAELYVNYFTKTETNTAISEAKTLLSSTIDDVESDLQVNYSTTAEMNTAISAASTILKSNIDDNQAVLVSDYYTKTAADSAISNATTQLKSAIEDQGGSSIGADLYNNYYTKTGADGAISTANQLLKATLEDANGDSLGASLQTLSQTVATNEGVFSALWGVKTNVNGLQSSVGLVNDGVEPIFAVKGAKFAIITDQDPTNLTPVFAVQGNQTVINSAVIDQAFIQSLVTDELLSNRVTVGSSFTTPSINYDRISGARSGNFSIDPNGNMLAKSATLESVTIKDNNGNIVMSSTGAVPWDSITGSSKPADGADVTANNKSLGTVIEDTRNDNNPPSWYRSIKGMGQFTEFKSRTTVQAPGSSGFGTLQTIVPWNDETGGKVTQHFFGNDGTYKRVSLSETTWGNWGVLFDKENKPHLSDIPDSGPFAGLSKILSSNVSTYIANGAIGSAQIDQAYINQLFGNNASFYGTVYAKNLEGDVYDVKVKNTNFVIPTSSNKTLVSFTVSAQPFTRNVVISEVEAYGQGYSSQDTFSVNASMYGSHSSSALDNKSWSGRGDTAQSYLLPSFIATIPANTTRTFSIRLEPSGTSGTVVGIRGSVKCEVFKDGSTIS